MLADLDIALLLQKQYDGTPDVFDVTIDVSGVYCSVKHFEDCDVICFRGSTTWIDFIRDGQSLMVQDATLGGVEQGFIQGIRDVKAHLDSMNIGYKTIIIAGHSLGAARALLYAGIETEAGYQPEEVVVFGAPRPGGKKLKDILAPVSIRSYCNGKDAVCRVPFDIEPFEPYCEPREFIMLNEPPTLPDPWPGDIAWHHLQLYIKGLQK